MEPKEAARLAKQHISDLFSAEGAKHIGLEEIEFDGASGTWRVTVGFSRPWDDVNEPSWAAVTEIAGVPRKRMRDMKVVVLSDTDGRVISINNRE